MREREEHQQMSEVVGFSPEQPAVLTIAAKRRYYNLKTGDLRPYAMALAITPERAAV